MKIVQPRAFEDYDPFDPEVLTVDAMSTFRDWLKNQGYEGRVSILTSSVYENRVEIQCLRPYGLFIVCGGDVDDNYGTFDNPRFCPRCKGLLREGDTVLCDVCQHKADKEDVLKAQHTKELTDKK